MREFLVSLDDAVVARLDRMGHRFEVLVDPEGVDVWKLNPEATDPIDLLAAEGVWKSARDAERHSDEILQKAFETTDLSTIIARILHKGDIQLTTGQRKARVEQKRRKVIHYISTEAVDPKTGLPHPVTRIEGALAEVRFIPDPFTPTEILVKEAISLLRPLLPLSFETIRLALKVPGTQQSAVFRVVRTMIIEEEWLSGGEWVCVVELAAAQKGDLMGRIARSAPDLEVKEL